MNVTKTEVKCSQLPSDSSQKEGSLQKNSAEHEGYAGVHSSGRINLPAGNSKEGNRKQNTPVWELPELSSTGQVF